MKFKNDIELQAGLEDLSGSTGTSGQLLSSTGTGTSWIAQDDIISAASKLVVIACKNTHTATILKGTPVYQTGTVGATDVIEVAPAAALISLGHQPAVGLLQQDLAINEFGNVVITGELLNFTTDPIDGLTPVTGQKVFLKSSGGLTLTKPTGVTNGIQNLGLIGKVSVGSAGSITVSSIMRTNDVPNLTTGKIWVGEGNTVESTVVHLDEVNGRMGIGTSSPINGKLVIDSTANQIAIETGTAGDGRLNIGHFSNGTFIGTYGDDGGAADLIRFGTHSGDERMRITSAGNVGIGITNPTSGIHVNTSQSAARFISSQGAGLEVQGGGNSQPIASFKDTAASEKVRISSTGNVGIGTTSPAKKLHVKESTTATYAAYIENSIAGGDYLAMIGDAGDNVFEFDSGGTGGEAVLKMYSDGVLKNQLVANGTSWINGGNVGIGTTSPGYKLDVNGTLHSSNITLADGIYHEGDTNTYINFLSDTIQMATAGSVRAYINSAGNVGIGTTSPGGKLTVSANGAEGIEFFPNNFTNGNTIQHYDRTGLAYSSVKTIAGDHRFNIGTSEAMRIDSASNVGIGTTSPSAKLEINDSANALQMRIGSLTAGISPYFRLQGKNTANTTNYYADIALDAENGKLIFKDPGTSGGTIGQSPMVIDSSGNVGIGTTSPTTDYSKVLQINASGNGSTLRLTDAGSGSAVGNGLELLQYGVDSYIINRENGVMRFWNNNASKMVILANGNVGINTTSPANKLDVVGISRFTHSSSTSYRGAIETVVDNAFPTWDIGWLHARTGSSTYGNIARFNDQNGSQIGGIFYSGASGTSFVTTSDYRLKENIKEISDSISRVKKLKPCRFNFATEKNRVIDGFIAHEVQEVVPEAVHGEKDALQKDGSINAQTLEVSRLIPVLTKALQEAINKIEELELRIQTIENN